MILHNNILKILIMFFIIYFVTQLNSNALSTMDAQIIFETSNSYNKEMATEIIYNDLATKSANSDKINKICKTNNQETEKLSNQDSDLSFSGYTNSIHKNIYQVVPIKILEQVIKYAQKHELQLALDKYNIEKTDVKNGDKYRYVYPCIDKYGNIYAILYKNKFYIKIARPHTVDILYLECR